MGAGGSVHATVDVAGRSTSEVSRAVERAMSGDGSYRSASVGTDTVQFVRTFRPMWALLGGLVGLPFFGLGLLLLFVRRTETCTMAVVNGPTGSVLTITGRLVSGRLEEIKAALSSAHAENGNVAYVGRAAAEASVQPIPSVRVGLAGSLIPSTDETMARRHVRPQLAAESTAARYVILLPDGTSVPLEGTTLLGRDPSPTLAGTGARLVPVADPARQVSKTHLALRMEQAGLVAEDLHSTNGTGVTDPSGRWNALVPGRPEPISAGSALHLGDQRIEIVASG